MPATMHDGAAAQPSDNPQSPHAPADQDPLDPIFTDYLLQALVVALPAPDKETDGRTEGRRAAAIAALRSLDVQHPFDAMLATHAVLAHHFAMECYRRAALSSQTANLDTHLIGTAAMLSRTLGATLNTMQIRQEDDPIWCGSRETPFP